MFIEIPQPPWRSSVRWCSLTALPCKGHCWKFILKLSLIAASASFPVSFFNSTRIQFSMFFFLNDFPVRLHCNLFEWVYIFISLVFSGKCLVLLGSATFLLSVSKLVFFRVLLQLWQTRLLLLQFQCIALQLWTYHTLLRVLAHCYHCCVCYISSMKC